MSSDNNHGKNRHEEHMFALHGTAHVARTPFKNGTQIRIEALLEHHGVAKADAEETATAIYKGLERYSDNPPQKQAEFVAMMVGPLLKDPQAGFTAKPDPQKLKVVVDEITTMTARLFNSKLTLEPLDPTPGHGASPHRPKF